MLESLLLISVFFNVAWLSFVCVFPSVPCNTATCEAWGKRCPGSSNDFLANTTLLVPSTECSGHGSCHRIPTLCRADQSCSAVCDCEAGWGGRDCAMTTEAIAAAAAIRANYLTVMVRSKLLL